MRYQRRYRAPRWLALACVLLGFSRVTRADNTKSGASMSVEIRLACAEAKRTAEGWSLKVSLRFTNHGHETFDLDKVSIGDHGEIENNVFEIRHGEQKISYRGIMKKRAPPGPSGFYHLAPGKTHVVTLRLDRDYALPAEGGELTVVFATMNHFSKDAVELRSNAVTCTLRP